LQLDLASLESIREFSEKFHQLEDKLHVLINNAGLLKSPSSHTKEGFEIQIGVNHLGHFALTHQLLDLLKSGAPSRIVVVSSFIHHFGVLHKNDSMRRTRFNNLENYYNSKLANNLFTHELAKKLDSTGVTVNCLHPGVVMTNLLEQVAFLKVLARIAKPFLNNFINSSEEAAQPSIKLAVDPALEKVTGKYFYKSVEKKPSNDSTNDELSSWLWTKSEELVGNFPIESR
jgi:NAD(P)-dependent dehydrogenase (short-subunit alcohol dehydrogenase family)